MPDSIAAILPLLTSVAGTTGNVINSVEADRRNTDVYNAYMARFNKYNKLTPQGEAAGIGAMTQPLSADLIRSISTPVAADMASRGLLGAGGLYQDALAQALAPYIFQEQGRAQDAYFQGMGLGAGIPLPTVPNASKSANPFAALTDYLKAMNTPGLVAPNVGTPDYTGDLGGITVPPEIIDMTTPAAAGPVVMGPM